MNNGFDFFNCIFWDGVSVMFSTKGSFNVVFWFVRNGDVENRVIYVRTNHSIGNAIAKDNHVFIIAQG